MKKLIAFASSFESYRSGHLFSGNPASLYEPMNYIMDLGGKRIRPALVYLGAEACGATADQVHRLALAVETFHNFSLVHDDIMDAAPVRRGKPTVHLRWNLPTAILAGDNMLVESMKLVLEHPVQTSAIAGLFLKTAGEVCDGQQMDMDFELRSDVQESEYLEMIRLKTAVLLGCSIGMGALAAGADANLANTLYDFAVSAGLGFQLRDDYLDSFGDPALTGKQPGGDILANKKTWLWIHAFNNLPESGRQELLHWKSVQDPSRAEEKVHAVKALMHQTEADIQLARLSDEYYAKAAAILEPLDISTAGKSDLHALLDFLRDRTH